MSAKEMPVYREEKVETPVAVKEVKTEKKTVKKASKPKIVKKKANIKKSLRRF